MFVNYSVFKTETKYTTWKNKKILHFMDMDLSLYMIIIMKVYSEECSANRFDEFFPHVVFTSALSCYCV